MFACKKAEFKVENISFSLPEGILLDFSDCDFCNDGFQMFPQDESFRIVLYFIYSNFDIQRLLSMIHCKSKEVCPIKCQTLEGYKLTYDEDYEGEKIFYEEYMFDIKDGVEYNRMNIVASWKEGKCNTELKNKYLSEIFESIKISK